NIALINELALIFNNLGIDTAAVLEAAGTKWNFLPFRPGLVGGHCIGVDPYYLTHKAQALGYHPEVILAGRRLNDSMGVYVASELVKAMTKKKIQVQGAKVLIFGLSFKENCPDIRNTRVVDIMKELDDYGVSVSFFDPWVDKKEAWSEYNVELVSEPRVGYFDAIILAVAHKEFKEMGSEKIREFGRETHILYDLKYLFPPEETDL